MSEVITDNTDTLYAALREIDRLRAENDALKAQRGEPAVLQIKSIYGVWEDVSEKEFDELVASGRVCRRLFTAPPATDALVEALEECTTYLGLSQFNQIASGSKLHQLMGAALETYRASQRKEPNA